MILTIHNEGSHEGAKHLGKDIVWDLFPRETLPDGEADGNGRVEVACRTHQHDIHHGWGYVAYPPDTAPQVMMANAIPNANANPTWSKLPYAAFSWLRRNDAVAATPG